MLNNENGVLCGDFSSFKHIKTRKVFTIEIEFPEEQGRMVLETLGMPIGGESKPVAIALLDNSKKEVNQKQIGTKTEFSEAEKLRTRAILLCRDNEFLKFINSKITSSVNGLPSESECAWYIKKQCNIKSRSELAYNIDAQIKFKKLLEEYKDWQLIYQDERYHSH